MLLISVEKYLNSEFYFRCSNFLSSTAIMTLSSFEELQFERQMQEALTHLRTVLETTKNPQLVHDQRLDGLAFYAAALINVQHEGLGNCIR